MSKHTKGPWKIDAGPNHYSIRNQRGCVLTDMRLPNNGVSIKEVDANAHLISASPDMIATLENIVEYWNRDRNDSAMHDALWYIIGVAEQAIAKAEGK